MVLSDMTSLIAVVEDDPSVRKALTRLLQAAGFEVRAFGSGEDFLYRTETDHFACMLLDVTLPGISGFDLYCSGTHIPTIFITADESNWPRAETLGINHEMFLCKPFSDVTLLRAINDTLSH
jgi:FixJ family two-component response regulator